MMNFDDETIERLALGFEALTLRDAEWTHTAHLVVALRCVRRYGRAGALTRMRDGLLRWAGAHGKPEKYHETITRAYVAIIAAYAAKRDHGQSLALLARDMVEELGDKDYLLHFYSRERIFSAEARACFVVPDLVPLPLAIGDLALRESAA